MQWKPSNTYQTNEETGDKVEWKTTAQDDAFWMEGETPLMTESFFAG